MSCAKWSTKEMARLNLTQRGEQKREIRNLNSKLRYTPNEIFAPIIRSPRRNYSVQSDNLHIETRSRERTKKQEKKNKRRKREICRARREDPTLHRLSGFRPVAPIRSQLGRHCYVNGGRLGGIILGWAVGNDVIIFQHQYPGVGGAQLINHFVKRERKWRGAILYSYSKEGGLAKRVGLTPRPYLSGAPIHGSWIMDRGG